MIRAPASVRENWASSSVARDFASERDMPYSSPTICRFSTPVRYSSTAADWPDRPISSRTPDGFDSRSTPAIVARPASGFSSVDRIRTAVVLPAPLGPRTPCTVPSGTDRSMPARAVTSP